MNKVAAFFAMGMVSGVVLGMVLCLLVLRSTEPVSKPLEDDTEVLLDVEIVHEEEPLSGGIPELAEHSEPAPQDEVEDEAAPQEPQDNMPEDKVEPQPAESSCEEPLSGGDPELVEPNESKELDEPEFFVEPEAEEAPQEPEDSPEDNVEPLPAEPSSEETQTVAPDEMPICPLTPEPSVNPVELDKTVDDVVERVTKFKKKVANKLDEIKKEEEIIRIEKEFEERRRIEKEIEKKKKEAELKNNEKLISTKTPKPSVNPVELDKTVDDVVERVTKFKKKFDKIKMPKKPKPMKPSRGPVERAFGNSCSMPAAKTSSKSSSSKSQSSSSAPANPGLPDFPLTDRKLVGKLAEPKFVGDEQGKIVVDICVNADGYVTQAICNRKKTNISDPKLRKEAEKAAMKTRFSEAVNNKEDQWGTITYDITIKR